MGSEPVEIEVPEFDSAASVFRTWAGQGAPVHLVFGPDPILAVDLPGRRGYLIDDIHFAVAWVAEGIEDLLQALRAQGIDAIQRSERGGTEVHEDLLDMLMRNGNVLRSQP